MVRLQIFWGIPMGTRPTQPSHQMVTLNLSSMEILEPQCSSIFPEWSTTYKVVSTLVISGASMTQVLQ